MVDEFVIFEHGPCGICMTQELPHVHAGTPINKEKTYIVIDDFAVGTANVDRLERYDCRKHCRYRAVLFTVKVRQFIKRCRTLHHDVAS